MPDSQTQLHLAAHETPVDFIGTDPFGYNFRVIYTRKHFIPFRKDGVPITAELWDRCQERSHPIATAYLSDYRSGSFRVMLVDYVWVNPDDRRKGMATEFLRACSRSFGKLALTDAISRPGLKLLKRAQQIGIAETLTDLMRRQAQDGSVQKR